MKAVQWQGKDIYPSKIVCVGRNYVGHIMELNSEVPSEPVIFNKPNSSISNEIYFNKQDIIHFEGEISFLVWSGKLAAVGFGLDLTKRKIQTELKEKGLPWERAKAFDGAAVFSNFVNFSGDTSHLCMKLYINKQLIQTGETVNMLYKPQTVLEEVSKFITFEDGDLIMTGTPKGVGPINCGDVFLAQLFERDILLIESSWVVK